MIRSLATLAAVLVLALAGCGGDDESSSSGGGAATSTPASGSGGGGGGGGEQLALSAPADGSLKFDKSKLEAKAGTVTIDFDNLSDSTPHAVEIEGNGVEEKSDTVTGAKTSVTADLDAGTYTFYCPVGDHRAEGMEGTLTVK
ncbi:MAG TPA: plastocyanin/azurin family copper-binding protein [Solirubrobacteraceae bacterium]|jgi:plastocyanin|nr:plastocyanin/azurin family copper-binding protein [Solirubrobacteraceae bacterium]